MSLPVLLAARNLGPPVPLANPAMVVATVAQEAIARLARTFRQVRAPSNPSALNIAPEIILIIATHLDGCALLSLALTCRSLYRLLERRRLSLQSAEKEELLLLLEKDIPFLYYCHQCTKLHRWHGRWSRSVVPWYLEHLPCKRNLHKHICLIITCHIPYHHARLVMNRHFYGPKHGLPVHALNERLRTRSYLSGIVSSVSQHARIFNDQLLVLSVISITHPRGDSVLLRSHVDSYGHNVCEHIALKEGYRDFMPMQIPELVKKGNAQSQFLACGPVFGSCTFCPTDYSISITWQGASKGYNIEVLAYRGLGDCRTPFDWHWRTLSMPDLVEDVTPAYPPDHRPESVRDQWNKAGSAAETTNGAWWKAMWR